MIATLVGSTGGAVVGLWSVRDRTTSVAVSQMSSGGGVAVSSASPTTDATSGESGRDLTARDGLVRSIAVATTGGARSTAPDAAVRSGSAHIDDQDVVQRARALAELPDVYALVAFARASPVGRTSAATRSRPRLNSCSAK